MASINVEKMDLTHLPSKMALEMFMRTPGNNQRAIVDRLHHLAHHARSVHNNAYHDAVDGDENLREQEPNTKSIVPKRAHTAHFWRDHHVFAELDCYRNQEWVHTHRWNHGLEEQVLQRILKKDDIFKNLNTRKIAPEGVVEKSGVKIRRRSSFFAKNSSNFDASRWGKPHLPQVSVYGLEHIVHHLSNHHIMLNVHGLTFASAVENIIDTAVSRKIFPKKARDEAVRMICGNERRDKQETRDGVSPWERYKIKMLKFAEDKKNKELRSKQIKHDVIEQDVTEEAMLIKVAESDIMRYQDVHDNMLDDFDSDHRIILFARLEYAVNVGMDLHDARFLVIVLGVDKSQSRQLNVEIGASFAALMQDENICEAAYSAIDPPSFREALERGVRTIKMVPKIHRPTKQGIKKREIRMGRELLSTLAQESSHWAKWEKRQHIKHKCETFPEVIETATVYALPLMFGIIIALFWANVEPTSYSRIFGAGHHDEHASSTASSSINASQATRMRRMLSSSSSSACDAKTPTILNLHYKHDVTINFVVNDIFMCFFFGLAVKEITEALSVGGSMYPPQEKAINPLLGTFGGVFGPIVFYVIFTVMFYEADMYPAYLEFSDVMNGWGIPTATDISLAWVTAFFVFGKGHPAILYLLLLAIVDDGLGLLIIAFAYPDKSQTPNYVYLVLILIAMLISYTFRKLNFTSWKLYVMIAGPFAWFGLMEASLHPALALCFVVPFMPGEIHHGDHGKEQEPEDEHEEEEHSHHHAPLHAFEHDLKPFVDIFVMFSFGIVNGGVQMKYVGPMTITIFASLVLGKTVGVGVMSIIGKQIGYPPPPGIGTREGFMVGFIASIGLTVALFVSGVAFPSFPQLEGEAKMGSLLSIFSAAIAIVLSKTVCKFSLPKESSEKQEQSMNIDIDSESDDEAVDEILVSAQLSTLNSVEKSKKKVENLTGIRELEYAKQEGFLGHETDKQKVTTEVTTVDD